MMFRPMNIAGFELLEKLGESAMTELWMARQVTLDRLTAIRVLKPGFSSDEHAVNSFVREARLPVKIRHGNVPEIYDVAHSEEAHYVVFEHVIGMRVAEMVQRDGPLSPQRALRIALAVAGALDAAWQQAALTHGGINPSCIRVDDGGTVKVLDLGFKHVGDPAGVRVAHPNGLPAGIPNYLAPEQVDEGTVPSARTDMYALGATLFYMTTGRVPFAGDSPRSILGKHRADQLPNPRDVNPKVTPGLANLIAQLMMKAPGDRPADWQSVIKSIEGLLAGRVAVRPVEGNSTIAPSQRTQAAPRKSERERTGPPAAVRNLAWLGLLVLWVAVVIWRWRETGDAETEALATRTAVDSAVVSSADRGPADGRGTGPEADSVSQAPGMTDFNSLVHAVSAAVLDSRPRDARAMVLAARTAPHAAAYRDALPELDQFLAEVCRMTLLLEEAFRAKVGQTVMLTHNRRKYRVLLQATAGGRVRGLVGEQPVVFEISQLNPLELSHWLGPPKSAAECAMKAMLHNRGQDAEGARVFAGRSGPLADSMRAILAASDAKPDAAP